MRPRSGLAAKSRRHGSEQPGTIDADYRGEVAVILINLGNEPFVVTRGERIAQMIVAPVTRVKLREARKALGDETGCRRFRVDGYQRDTILTKAKKQKRRCKIASSAGAKKIPSPRSGRAGR